MNCPSCKSSRVYRSKARSTMEKSMHAVLPIRYYRCHACNWRGMRFQRRTLNIILVVFLGLISGFLLFELASPVIKLMLHLVLS